MRIIASYGDKSIDLEGSKEALLELAEALKHSKGDESIPFLIPPESPSPYRGYAKVLRFQHNQEFALVSRMDDEILVSGTPEKLTALGRNIGWFAEHPQPSSPPLQDHMHIEFYPGHFFLKKESIPMVITRYDES